VRGQASHHYTYKHSELQFETNLGDTLVQGLHQDVCSLTELHLKLTYLS